MKSTITSFKRPFWTMFFALVLILGSCTKSDELITPKDGDLKLKTGEACEPVKYEMNAGQNNPAGFLTVSNDNEYLYVKFDTEGKYSLKEVHVGAYCNEADLPNPPSPGQIGKDGASLKDLGGAYTAEVKIALNNEILSKCLFDENGKLKCGYELFILAHAETNEGETIWAGNYDAPGANWAKFLKYTICCDVPKEEEKCDEETAMGGGVKGGGKAWWYYYTAGSGSQTIWAGQNKEAGRVVVENGYATITLNKGWSLQDVSEPVKIQGYNDFPLSRPSAGLFTTYKGSDLVNIPVGNYSYYVIHLDVKYCYMVPVN